jgi:hypothetical protein
LFIEKLQNAYTTTAVSEESQIKEILEIDPNNSSATEILSSTILRNTL